MNQVLLSISALLLGCALRTLFPYIITGFQEWQSNKPWPKFEYKYLGSFGLAVVAYALTLLTSPGAFESLLEMSFVYVVALSYAGTDISRQLIKGVSALVKK